MVYDALEMLVIGKTAGGVTEVDGLGDDVVGAEMNESPMPSEADIDELVVVATVQRDEAAMSSGVCQNSAKFCEKFGARYSPPYREDGLVLSMMYQVVCTIMASSSYSNSWRVVVMTA